MKQRMSPSANVYCLLSFGNNKWKVGAMSLRETLVLRSPSTYSWTMEYGKRLEHMTSGNSYD